VIDQSGSMQGDKLEFAKKAAIMIVENLIEGDVLHVVTYSDNATTIFTGGNYKTKREIISAIESVNATSTKPFFFRKQIINRNDRQHKFVRWIRTRIFNSTK